MLSFLAAVVLSPTQLMAPPFRQSWSVHAGSLGRAFGLFGSVYVFEEGNTIRAIDFATGKDAWKRPWTKDEFPVGCPSDPGTLYLGNFSPFPGMTPKRGKQPIDRGAIVQLDPKSGKTLLYVPTSLLGGCSVANGRAYLVDASNHLKALDLRTRKVLWSTRIAGEATETSDPCFTPDIVAFEASGDPRVRGGSRVSAVARATGRFLWSHPCDAVGLQEPLIVGNTLVVDDEGIVGLDPRTGHENWKVPSEGMSSGATVVDGKVVFCFSRTLLELDPASGAVLWHYRLRSNQEYDLPIEVVRWKDWLLVSEEPFAALSLDGKEFWRTSGIEGHVLWTDGRVIVTSGLQGILAYEHGERPPLPTTPAAKRARAIELCRTLSTLDENGKEDLVSLGEPAFDPLLEATIKVAREFEKGHSVTDDALLEELPQMLSEVAAEHDLPKLVRAVRASPVNHTVGRTLLPALLMSKAGNEKDDVTVCLWVLSKEQASAWPGDESSIALSFLRVCTDSRAKKYVRNWDRKHPVSRRKSGSRR